MRPPPTPALVALALTSFIGGCVTGGCVGANTAPADQAGAIYAPLPHHVPPSPDAAPFRFAMVHDVIHERYPRHGPAFYQERERLARERMAVLHPDSEASFALTDDIAVGLARRGRTDEAIALMRDKLKRQQARELNGKELYSSYANLGEFLVLGNLWAMMAGDAAARQQVQEGRDFLRKSVEVRPSAHFDLEAWQLVAVDFWLEAASRPDLLERTDLIGNRVDQGIGWLIEQVISARERVSSLRFGRAYDWEWTWDYLSHEDGRRQYAAMLADAQSSVEVRRHIARVGNESAPDEWKGTERGKAAAFDEPTLWLVGEWRQGSGPNPHYALCLGEIMLRVGQRYLAWTCYERAARLAEQFWPTPDLQQFLREHCKKRQGAIERSLPAAEVAELRPKFEAELAFGDAYQRAYQAYEEEKIQAGADLNDPRFYDEFHTSRPPIASPVGPEEWYAGSSRSGQMAARFEAFWEWGLFTGGAVVLALALLLTWLCRAEHPLGAEFSPRP